MEAEGRAVLARERVGREPIVSIRAALDLRYVGQWHELTVPIEEHGSRRRSRRHSTRSTTGSSATRLPACPVELLAVQVDGARLAPRSRR